MNLTQSNRCVLAMRCAALLPVLVVGLPAIADDNLLVNGGFESMPNWNNGIGGDGSYTLFVELQIPGWTIEKGHAATIHNTNTYPTISGAYSLNTDGEGFNGHNVNIYQDFGSGPGQSMTLTFDWMNWFQSSVPQLNVSVVDTVTNAVLANGTYGVSGGLHSEQFDFLGTGNTLRLRVMHSPESGVNDNTFIVDNFKVVPTPGAVAVLGVGALAAGRRRRA